MTSHKTLTLDIGHDELVIRRRYEALSIANDVLIALWFLVGSILFFWESTMIAATWCFLLGSIEFLARPAIRLARLVHVRRIGGDGLDSANDY
jgi:YrhK-like protein